MSFSESYFKEGAVVLIDKPLHWTSFQVVNIAGFYVSSGSFVWLWYLEIR